MRYGPAVESSHGTSPRTPNVCGPSRVRSAFAATLGVILIWAASGSHLLPAEERAKSLTAPPAIGDKVPDFELQSLAGTAVKLSEISQKGNVVLVVLRGFPGYQCPICSRQVGELLSQANELQQARAQVLLIYPGPPEKLKQRAQEFLGKRSLGEPFQMLLDPDYSFTNAYALRWDAPRETAYPSTFVIGQDLTVRYAKVSRTHGDRARTADVLQALK